jgi:hypothetical protein
MYDNWTHVDSAVGSMSRQSSIDARARIYMYTVKFQSPCHGEMLPSERSSFKVESTYDFASPLGYKIVPACMMDGLTYIANVCILVSCLLQSSGSD